MGAVEKWFMAVLTVVSLIVTMAMGYGKLEEKALSAAALAVEAKEKAAEARKDAISRFDKLDAKIDDLSKRMPCGNH